MNAAGPLLRDARDPRASSRREDLLTALSLLLLMLRVLTTDDHHDTVPTDHLTIRAARFHRSTHFHDRLPSYTQCFSTAQIPDKSAALPPASSPTPIHHRSSPLPSAPGQHSPKNHNKPHKDTAQQIHRQQTQHPRRMQNALPRPLALQAGPRQ